MSGVILTGASVVFKSSCNTEKDNIALLTIQIESKQLHNIKIGK